MDAAALHVISTFHFYGFQVCKQFDALADLGPADYGDLDKFRRFLRERLQ